MERGRIGHIGCMVERPVRKSGHTRGDLAGGAIREEDRRLRSREDPRQFQDLWVLLRELPRRLATSRPDGRPPWGRNLLETREERPPPFESVHLEYANLVRDRGSGRLSTLRS